MRNFSNNEFCTSVRNRWKIGHSPAHAILCQAHKLLVFVVFQLLHAVLIDGVSHEQNFISPLFAGFDERWGLQLLLAFGNTGMAEPPPKKYACLHSVRIWRNELELRIWFETKMFKTKVRNHEHKKKPVLFEQEKRKMRTRCYFALLLFKWQRCSVTSLRLPVM